MFDKTIAGAREAGSELWNGTKAVTAFSYRNAMKTGAYTVGTWAWTSMTKALVNPAYQAASDANNENLSQQIFNEQWANLTKPEILVSYVLAGLVVRYIFSKVGDEREERIRMENNLPLKGEGEIKGPL